LSEVAAERHVVVESASQQRETRDTELGVVEATANSAIGFYGFFWIYLAVWSALVVWTVRRTASRPAKSRAGRVARGLALSGLTAFALLLCAEGYFYFFHDTTDRTAVLLTSRRWTERHVRLNRAGFRDDPPPPAKREPGELRVLVLGDSFTFGHGVADPKQRYSDRLEELWRREGRNARVMNAAKPGWSSAHELKVLRGVQGGAALDLVILGYVLNDIDDLVPYPEEYWAAVEAVRTPPPSVAFFTRRSLALDFLYARTRLFGRAEFGAYDELMLSGYRTPEVWDKHTQTLREIAAACAKRGAPLLVATFPFFTRDWGDYRLGEAHRRLGELWAQIGVPHVDLLDTYRATPASELGIGRFDSHPNERAQAIAAERIFAAARTLVPPD
jgi:hypothetical protein